MKKIFTLLLLAMTASYGFALEIGEYVYTTTSKFKIAGENICVNGQFDGYEGWNSPADTTEIADCISLESAEGIQGYSAKFANNAGNVAYGMYQMFETDESSAYIVTFKMRNTAGAFTTSTTVGAVNYVNLFTNNTGNVSDQTTSEDTGVTFTSYGAVTAVPLEWTTVTFAFTNDTYESQFLFIEFAGLATSTEIAEVEVHKAEQVYDDRQGMKIVNYAETLLAYGCWKEMVEDLQDEISITKDVLENDPDNASDQVESLQGCIDAFLEENTDNFFTNYDTTSDWDNWYSSKYNYKDLSSRGYWVFTGGRWGSPTDSYIVGAAMPWSYDFPSPSIATYTNKFPKGKYLMQVEAYGNHMASKALNNTINPGDTTMWFRQFVGNDTTEAVLLSPIEFNYYMKMFDVEDETVSTSLGYVAEMDSTILGNKKGGSVQMRHMKILKVKVEGERTLEELALLESVQTQIDALLAKIHAAQRYIEDAQYPWGKSALQVGIDAAQIYYDEWAVKTEDEILEYWDQGNQSPADTIMNSGVRALQNGYMTPFITLNDPVTDLKPELDDAYVTYADPLNKEGDLVTYKKVIDAAQADYDYAFTITDGSSEDSLRMRTAAQNLVDAKVVLKMSIAKWGNPCELPVVNPNFTESSGSKGSFQATGWEITNESSNGGWSKSYETGHSSSDADADDWAQINFWRGNTAFPQNKCQQTIDLTVAGMYVFQCNAMAFNEVESKDKTMYTYAQEWDPDWEEWVTTDSVNGYNSGCRLFFGPNGMPDSLDAHKDIFAENLEGLTPYAYKNTYGSVPTDVKQIEYEKKTADTETFEFGFDCLANGTTATYGCNTGRMGQVKVLYFGDAEAYRKAKEAAAAGKKGDANNDGVVDVADITAIASYILGSVPTGFNTDNADANGDSTIDVADITATASIILGN